MDVRADQREGERGGPVRSPSVTTANPADQNSGKEKKKRKSMVIPKLEEDQYHLPCEWGECRTVSRQMQAFISHVSLHIMEYFTHVPAPVASSGMCFTCGWRDCGAQILGSVIDFNRHVYYHVFHVRLKCLGAHMSRVQGLGACMLGSQSCNWIPELPENLQCAWDDCKIIFDNPYVFYSHVLHHCEEFPEGNNNSCKCLWHGCNTTVRSKHKMKDHVRSHTQEKQVACPTCGGLFVSHTKLSDHILRQAQSDTQRFECSHCSHRFATERMLREHMRRHVNHYKCPLCEMTCPCPSALKNHMRYRHSDEKPFKCGHCDFSAKSSYDLRKHLDSHNVEDQFTCHIPNCPFSARSYSSLDLHFKKHHQNVDVTSARYMCHVCNRVFGRGYSLTFHLKKKHHFQWPPGHSRFKYRMHTDGFLRLQTVRYESVVVSEPSASNDDGGDVAHAAVPSKSRRKKCIITTSMAAPPPPETNGDGENGGDGEEEGASGLRIVEQPEAAPVSADVADAAAVVAGKESRKKKASPLGTRPKSSRKRKSGGKESGLPDGAEKDSSSTEKGVSSTNGGGDIQLASAETGTGRFENGTDVGMDSSGVNGAEDNTGHKTRAKRNKAAAGTKTRQSGRRSGSKKNTASKKQDAEPAENLAETAAVGTEAADNLHTHPSQRDPHSLSSNTLEDVPGNLSDGERTTVTKPSRKRKRQERSRSPPKRRRATLTRSNSLDECPPEMVEIQWQADPVTQTGQSTTGQFSGQADFVEIGVRLYEGHQPFHKQVSGLDGQTLDPATRIVRVATGPQIDRAETHLTDMQPSRAYGFRRGNLYPAEQQTPVQSAQQLNTEQYAVYKNYDHGEGCGTVDQTSASIDGIGMPGSSRLQALGLHVAEYGDSAEANLHMLGDVALTSLRVPKEKTPPVSTRRTRRK